MTRRVLACLFALAVLFALLAPPGTATEKRSSYPTYDYTVCERYHNLLSSADVCLKTLVTRQSDGVGYIVHNFRIYTNVIDTADDCDDALFNNPAVINKESYIWSLPPGDTNTPWSAVSPDLKPDNGCYWKYEFTPYAGEVILVPARRAEIHFDYKVRIKIANDFNEDMYLRLVEQTGSENLVWSCDMFVSGNTPDTCSRVVVN